MQGKNAEIMIKEIFHSLVENFSQKLNVDCGFHNILAKHFSKTIIDSNKEIEPQVY